MTETFLEASVGSPGLEPEFELYMEKVMRHLSITTEGDEIILSLSPSYSGREILDGFAELNEVESWTPLMLAQALADFKNRVGGAVRIVAVGEDFVRLSQSRCEFGEPREGKYRGNLCEVCRAVTGAVAWASGIAALGELPGFDSTIAGGARSCDFTVALS